MLEVLLIIVAILCSVSLFALYLTKKSKVTDFSGLVARVKLWWGMVFVFSASILLDERISMFALAILCFFSLKEFFGLINLRKNDRRIFIWAYLSVPVQFYFVYIGWYGMFIIFIPIYMFLFLPLVRISSGGTKGYLKSISSIQWGMMLMVFGLSHLAYFQKSSPEDGAKFVLFLVLLTQLNDVIQYLVSKTFGKRLVIPTANTNITVEGFVSSFVITVLSASLLGPFLTPMNLYFSIGAGVLISIGGFIGSLNLSFVKRDLTLSDNKAEEPNLNESFLSRIDSLSFTAPLFFHFAHYFFF